MIKIIDDAVPYYMINKALYYMNTTAAWSITPTATEEDEHISIVFQFKEITSTIFFQELGTFVSNFVGLSPYSLFRIRPGAIFRDNKKHVNTAHVDSTKPHYVGLLYVGDSDGETVIYEGAPHSDNFKIIKKIEPKNNRLVFFDGSYYHSSSTPVENQIRMAINFNWQKEKVNEYEYR